MDHVRDHLHIVLCMSPTGDSLRRALLQYPSLSACCAINWMEPWPSDGLTAVAFSLLQSSVRQLSPPETA